MRECLEQVSIGRYPRQRKYRESGAHALVYWRGSESTPAGASRAGESTPASTTRRRGGAKWGERVAPAFARVALASRANGPSRHQSWRESSPKVARLVTKVARLGTKVADFVADSPEARRYRLSPCARNTIREAISQDTPNGQRGLHAG